LLIPTASPWQQLYDSKDDAALITVTGFDHTAFKAMHDMFKPKFDENSPWTSVNPGLNYRPVNREQKKGCP
jgi:hypothetical protein